MTDAAKRAPGRPARLDPSDRRRMRPISLSDAEQNRYAELATGEGLSLSALIRRELDRLARRRGRA